MNSILVWSKNRILHAAETSESPRAFTFDGRWFDLNKSDIGDVDYLRNEKGQLVGFCYILGDLEKENAITKRIIAQSNQNYIKDGFLFIFLSPCKKFKIETVQGIGTSIYYDDADGVILLIPDLGMGELAFTLTSDNVPIAYNAITTEEAIKVAFAAVPYPGDDNITRCTHEGCPECADIAAHFRGANWRDCTLEQLWKYNSAISMLTPEALHYFLPAFMIQSLGHWNDFDEIAFSIACQFSPNPNANESMKQYHAERYAKFSQQQRHAIAEYLREFAISNSPFVGAEVEQAISKLTSS